MVIPEAMIQTQQRQMADDFAQRLQYNLSITNIKSHMSCVADDISRLCFSEAYLFTCCPL